MILKTYNEWLIEGKCVIKGEHACLRENGKCYFNEKQVLDLENLKRIATNTREALKNKEEEKQRLKEDYYNYKNNDYGISKEQALSWLGGVSSSIYSKHTDDEPIGIIRATEIAFGGEDNSIFDMV